MTPKAGDQKSQILMSDIEVMQGSEFQQSLSHLEGNRFLMECAFNISNSNLHFHLLVYQKFIYCIVH